MSVPLSRILLASVALVGLPFLSACSGGGGGSTVAPPPPPGGSGPTFTPGTFAAASSFKNRCETPRVGVDSEGNAFPDLAGSLLEENFWLRSWTEETYLWNDQVTDQDPGNFSNRLDYFAVLKTEAVTASGEDLDDFHFSEPTAEFLERRNSTARSGYGLSLAVFSNSVPRDYRIRYTEPNSPASTLIDGEVPFRRGSRLLEIDGVDLVNGGATDAELDTLNNGLFPATAGESHTFKVQDVDGTERTFSIVSQDVTPNPVNRTEVIDTPTGKVGYILFNTFSPFSSEEAIATAFETMSNEGVSDLVLDLRYNGGGLLTVAAQLSYMIAGPNRTAGKTFELLQFNSNAGNRNPVTGEINGPIPFVDEGVGFSLAAGTQLADLDLPRVFILSTEGTCSASEAVINGLRGIDVEIILIGDVTCGKPYGFYPTDNCGETFYTIQFRGVNEKNFGDFSDGFVPMNSTFAFGERVAGCVVPDDLSNELGATSEGLLKAALDYRETGACPAVSTKPQQILAAPVTKGTLGQLATTDLSEGELILYNGLDMTPPPAAPESQN